MLPIRSSFYQSYFKKLLLFLLVMAFFSIVLFFFLSPKEQSSPSFEEITKNVFLENITTDTLSLHYTLAFPSTYGISSYPLTLPYYNDNNEKNSFINDDPRWSCLANVGNQSYYSSNAFPHHCSRCTRRRYG